MRPRIPLRVGLLGTTLIDFPGRVAAAVFLPGCNLRCPYCHNPELVTGPLPDTLIGLEDLFTFLSRRHRVLGGVVISGGEPLFSPECLGLIQRIHTGGLPVKLDTNGTLPSGLNDALPFLSYLALDIKTSFDNYHRLGGGSDTGLRILESLEILFRSCISFELRTTVVPGICSPEDIALAADSIRSLHKRRGHSPLPPWIFQRFDCRKTLDSRFTKCPVEEESTERAACRAEQAGFDVRIR